MTDKIIIAGFGGQGVLRIGQMLCYAGLDQGLEVSFLPSYSSEMRGGTANCNVIVSDRPVASPLVRKADFIAVMNLPSLLKFESWVAPGGRLVVNSTLVDKKAERTDIEVHYLPAGELADEAGNPRGMNMTFLGAYCALTGTLPIEALEKVVDWSFSGDKQKFADSNKALIRRGYDYIKQQSAVHA